MATTLLNSKFFCITASLHLLKNKNLNLFNKFYQFRLISTTFVNYNRYYEILEISQNADNNLIKMQYYKLSKKYHPDVNPNNENAHSKFLEINEAYSILGNEQSRKEYDRLLSQNSNKELSNRSRKASIHFQPRVRRRQNPNYGMYKDSSEKTKFESNQKYQEYRKNLKFNFNEHFQRHYEYERKRAEAFAEEEEKLENIKEHFKLSRRFIRVVLFVSSIIIASEGIGSII